LSKKPQVFRDVCRTIPAFPPAAPAAALPSGGFLVTILDTLLPLVLLIALGAVLARVGFLGRVFMADLNRLAFWIALPALLFESADTAAPGDRRLMPLLGVLIGGTAIVAVLAAVTGRLLGLSIAARATLVQATFRGNLAYIGIPVLSQTLGGDAGALARAVAVLVFLTAVYNVLAVLVLARADGGGTADSLPKVARSLATNPLLIAGVLGIVLPWAGVVPPQFVSRTLELLGAAAIPAALLCIGGSLATTSLRGSSGPILAAAILKVAVLPAVVFALARLAGLGPADLRTAVVFAACPTAAASFVMARQMGGDEPLASGAIAVSTALSAASVAAALAVTAL
jgi:predicted permease